MQESFVDNDDSDQDRDCVDQQTSTRIKLTTAKQMNTAMDRILAIETQVATLAEKINEIVELLKHETDKRQSIERRMGVALVPPAPSGGKTT